MLQGNSIEHQPLGHVVEAGHLARANDHQPLLLEGMEPGDVDMSPDAIVKQQVSHRHVGDIGLDVAATAGYHLEWHGSHQTQDDGSVMRGETPQDVLLPPHLAQAEAVGVAITAPATGASHTSAGSATVAQSGATSVAL